MSSFLQRVAHTLLAQNPSLEGIEIVMPSRRAAVFLKRALTAQLQKPVFAPQMSTIEEFLLKHLGWEQEDKAILIFKLYESYLSLPLKTHEAFNDFSKWAHLLLADYNEIDRYLVNTQDIYSFLADVKRIEQWDLSPGEDAHTSMVNAYLQFWEYLPQLYIHFTEALIADKKVYQGLAYRHVANQLSVIESKVKLENKRLVFVGFSALNKAEEHIFLHLFEAGIADFYWDVDAYYYQDNMHEAGKFLRSSTLIKKLRAKDKFFWETESLKKEAKKITIVEASGDTQQMRASNAKAVEFLQKQGETAVVLADEALLPSFLQQLAAPISHLNITMGLPLYSAPMASFFGIIWEMHIAHEQSQRFNAEGKPLFYHQYWDDLLSHPMFAKLLKEPNKAVTLRGVLLSQNEIFISAHEVSTWLDGVFDSQTLLLFENYGGKLSAFCRQAAMICKELKDTYDKEDYNTGLLFSFYKMFLQLETLFTRYDYVEDFKMAYQFYKDLLTSETIDLEGEPLMGLQVMGMLETRSLDFDNVILSAVNEDILPKGKVQNSMIPIDVKYKYGLPTYLDKDAVFAYHFYRLLQRAKHITLIYNGVSNGLSTGEPSRFIAQLVEELRDVNPLVQIEKNTAENLLQAKENKLEQIVKTPAIMERLQKMAERGISPTALIDYINDPLAFYYKRVLQIKETETVEEEIGYNTQGTVVHEILQESYGVKEDEKWVPVKVLDENIPCFNYTETDWRKQVNIKLKNMGLQRIDKGNNLLIRETIVAMLLNFFEKEKQELKKAKAKGLTVDLLGIEEEWNCQIDLPNGQKVRLRGVADRVDTYNDKIRIIDYKTGGVDSFNLSIKTFEDLQERKDKNKAFQLMMYAYLYAKNTKEISAPIEASIISLRNTKDWVLPFKFDKSTEITMELIEDFEVFLQGILSEIFDENIPFSEN